jgi:lysophospholipase L1-like esterase
MGDRVRLERIYADHFRRFANSVEQSGAKLMIAFLPAPTGGKDEETARFIASLAAERGLAFLDLTAALKARPMDEVYLIRRDDRTYPSDIHLSRTGHMLVAAAMAEVLEAAKLVP